MSFVDDLKKEQVTAKELEQHRNNSIEKMKAICLSKALSLCKQAAKEGKYSIDSKIDIVTEEWPNPNYYEYAKYLNQELKKADYGFCEVKAYVRHYTYEDGIKGIWIHLDWSRPYTPPKKGFWKSIFG